MTSAPQPKAHDYFFILILTAFTLLLCIVNSSCSRKILNQKQTENTAVTKLESASKTTEISSLISDTVFVQIPVIRTVKPDCDSLVAIELDQALSKLNYRKQSGTNSFGIYYDKYKKLLVQFAKIGATKNQNASSSKTEYVTITKTKTVDVPVRYIPKWVQYLAGFGALSAIYFGYRIVRIWV